MNRAYVSIFTSLVVAASCGDNAPNNVSPDAHGTSGPIAVAVAPMPMYDGPGILSKLDVERLETQTNVVAGVVGTDPVVRHIGDSLYVVNRFTDINVTIVDAKTLTLQEQISTGQNSNPQDVAVVGDKLYVPGTSGVTVGTRGSKDIIPIDLHDALGCKETCKPGDSPECRASCSPDCVSAYAIGSDVYVACGLIDHDTYKPTGNGKIAVIDATNDAVRVVVEMPVPNPYNQFVRTPVNSAFGGDLLIPTLDCESQPDMSCITHGTVVRVTPGASPSASLAIPSSDLQGSPSHIEVLQGQPPLLVMAVTIRPDEGRLLAFDLETEQLWNGSLSPATQIISDVAACPDGSVIVADRSGDGGLRVYSGSGSEVTSTALSIGLKPGTGNQIACYTP